jgi:hypothetical protein
MRNNPPREVFDDATSASPWNEDGIPKMLVTIDGLRQVGGENLFELAGVAPRNVDWLMVQHAFGFGDEPLPESLCEQLLDVIWDHDIREVLAKRIKRPQR